MITAKELVELGQKYDLDIGFEAGYPDFVFIRKYNNEIGYGVRTMVTLKDFAENPEDMLKSCSKFLERKMDDVRLNELRTITIDTEAGGVGCWR